MARRISDKTKQSRGMGKGSMENYTPYIETNEFNSLGTTSIITDWKHGRGVHCMSQAEADWYYILRWDDDNLDIREQFPLCDSGYSNEEALRIAEKLGIRYPKDKKHIMTTDFLVTRPGGRYSAYSVKSSPDVPKREREIMRIEEEYWKRRDVPFTILYRSEANLILADNVRLVCRYYDEGRVFDRYSLIRHRIAVKEYVADMEHEILDCAALDRIDRENKRRLSNVSCQ